MSHPQVADAGVVGMPHPTAGEVPTAWVVLKSGATVTTKELDEFVSGKGPSINDVHTEGVKLRWTSADGGRAGKHHVDVHTEN